MKKTLSLGAFLLLFSLIGVAQNNVNLVVFSEDLEPFYCYINGVRQNTNPETNVRISGITPNISLRIEFQNKAIPLIKQNMSLEPGFEHTARIKRDKNQTMKLRYFGQVPLEQSTAESSGISTVNYHTAESADNSPSTSQPSAGNVSVTSTTVTSNVNSGSGTTQNSSVNVNMPGVSINMNVNDPNAVNSAQTISSSTVTTTHSQSSTYSNGNVSPPPTTTTVRSGCSVQMSAASFNKMKESISSKPFSDTKMSTAKIATKNNCLSVNQVKEIANLFSMDDDRLDYAKYAYDYCLDKGNYYQVSEVFKFSGTADELNKFLEK